MFKRQRRAIQQLWDALSEAIETPGVTLPLRLKHQALKAIAEAQRVFQEDA